MAVIRNKFFNYLSSNKDIPIKESYQLYPGLERDSSGKLVQKKAPVPSQQYFETRQKVSETFFKWTGISEPKYIKDYITDFKEAKGVKYVKRDAVKKIIAAWVITVPASALLAAGIFYMIKGIVIV